MHQEQHLCQTISTEQGISKIKESSDRYNSFKASLEKAGE
jgi:uncharacterized protein with GYD domain